MLATLLLSPLLAYLLGSIPFGLILTRLAGLGDIRKIGSGNIGATNVLRTGNKGLAILTLVLDGFKGAAAVLIARHYAPDFLPLEDVQTGGVLPIEQSFFIFMMGVFAVLGHMFPVWLNFKGGKGVATFFGAILAIFPYAGVISLAVWLSTAYITRQSSTAALTATFSCLLLFLMLMTVVLYDPLIDPVTADVMTTYDPYSCLGLTALVALIWLKHHENIARLMNGTEPKIGNCA